MPNVTGENVSSSGNSSVSSEQQLEYFKALGLNDIQKIDFVYVRSENGGTQVYKTLTEKSDIKSILDVLQAMNLQKDDQEPTGGWTLFYVFG